jgi:hypothetical protein
MAIRIAVAFFTALRAVLIYGEATQLATRPIELPRLRFARRSGALVTAVPARRAHP